MSQKRAKHGRSVASGYSGVIAAKFDRMVPATPPAKLFTRLVWFLFPKKRREALLAWRVKRDKEREAYLALVTKKISHAAMRT